MLFRSLPKESIQEGLDLFFKEFNALAGKDMDYFVRTYGIGPGGQYVKVAGAEIPKVSFKTWGPPFLKEIGFEAGIPLTSSLINSFGEFIKNSADKLKYTPEELTRIKNAFVKAVNAGNFDEFEVYMGVADLATQLMKGDKQAKDFISGMTPMLENKRITNMTEEGARKIQKDMEETCPDYAEKLKKMPSTEVVIPKALQNNNK